MRPLKDLPTKSTQINGEYILPHPRIKDHFFCANVNILDGWECVGVGVRKRPAHSKSRLDKIARALTYEELAMVKNIFWKDEEVVTMFIPPFEVHLFGQQYVNYLWKPIVLPFPVPSPIIKLLEHYKEVAKDHLLCPKCAGSGTVVLKRGQQPVTCEHCDGLGEITVSQNEFDNQQKE